MIGAIGTERLLLSHQAGLPQADPPLTWDATLSDHEGAARLAMLGQADRAHAIVFQKPGRSLPFGGWRAFGHDGAMGCLGVIDPDAGVAFAWTVVRGPWPGGADPRALSLARDIPALLGA